MIKLQILTLQLFWRTRFVESWGWEYISHCLEKEKVVFLYLEWHIMKWGMREMGQLGLWLWKAVNGSCFQTRFWVLVHLFIYFNCFLQQELKHCCKVQLMRCSCLSCYKICPLCSQCLLSFLLGLLLRTPCSRATLTDPLAECLLLLFPVLFTS